MKPHQYPLLRKCSHIYCERMTANGCCDRCRAYFLQFPSDAAIAKGAQWPEWPPPEDPTEVTPKISKLFPAAPSELARAADSVSTSNGGREQ